MSASFSRLLGLSTGELVEIANAAGVENAAGMRRHGLLVAIALAESDDPGSYGTGVLEVHTEGFGFLRCVEDGFLPGTHDIYVSQSQIRRFQLQTGDTVIGIVRPPKEGERYPALLRVESVNGDAPGTVAPGFDTLTAIYPDERVDMRGSEVLRAVDWVAPLGLGQRGLIVAPGRTGRVALLRELAALFGDDGELEVTVLLIAEKPEEIAEWRSLGSVEVVASPFDDTPARQVQLADIVFERARRMVERGDDVVLLVDSLSRLLRACVAESTGGRSLDGVDVGALHRMRRYLGAARALEEGGSLTLVGCITGEADTHLDQVLLDDLREAANWTLTLSRDVADRGVRPAIDVRRSSSLRPERLLEPGELAERAAWRLSLTGDPVEDARALLDAVRHETRVLDRASGSGQ